MAAGIETRHTRGCRSLKGGRCDCEPSYRANVWDGERKERVRHTSTSLAGAQAWRRDAKIAIRRGGSPAVRHTATVRQIADEWQRLAKAGVIRAKGGEAYKSATLRAYERNLRLRVVPVYGDEPLAELSRADWQAFVDNLLADGVAPSTVNLIVASASALYEHEIRRERLPENPTRQVSMPAPDNGRERFATPQEAAQLLSALPEGDRATWATAFYANLRRGELQALRACDVRLDAGVIAVDFGWDWKDGRIPTKSGNRRKVPIPAILHKTLAAELLRTGRRGEQLVFGRTEGTPFSPMTLTARADKAWTAAGLERITLHECRHTYASFMIAAGVNAKALSTYMGHASIQITYDRYGHLMPGNESEAAGLLDTYLGRSTGA